MRPDYCPIGNEPCQSLCDTPCSTQQKYTTDAMKVRQAVAQSEPVAWMCADESLINKGYARFSHVCMGEWKIPVYTTPPQRTWAGLTEEELKPICAEWRIVYGAWMDDFAKDIEAKLKEKNS